MPFFSSCLNVMSSAKDFLFVRPKERFSTLFNYYYNNNKSRLGDGGYATALVLGSGAGLVLGSTLGALIGSLDAQVRGLSPVERRAIAARWSTIITGFLGLATSFVIAVRLISTFNALIQATIHGLHDIPCKHPRFKSWYLKIDQELNKHAKNLPELGCFALGVKYGQDMFSPPAEYCLPPLPPEKVPAIWSAIFGNIDGNDISENFGTLIMTFLLVLHVAEPLRKGVATIFAGPIAIGNWAYAWRTGSDKYFNDMKLEQEIQESQLFHAASVAREADPDGYHPIAASARNSVSLNNP